MPAHASTQKVRNITILAKVGGVILSYEVLAYSLAALQAAGLTTPVIVGRARVDTHAVCEANMRRILEAAATREIAHPELAGKRPTLDELAQFLPHGLPKCPIGGHYEAVPAGQTLTMDGKRTLVPEGRIGVHCAHGHGFGVIENPFEDVEQRPQRALRFGAKAW